MRMLFKQRLFSWFDSYDIYAQDGSTLFTVRGELSWGHCLRIYTRDGRYAGTVREKILTFLPRFELFVGDNSIGFLKREFTLFRPSYVLEANGWRITGNFMQWDYTVTEPSGGVAAKISKQLFNFTDTYVIDVSNPANALLALMTVLAIDAEKCSRG